MVSTFSNFSAVPDMTMFAKIGHSPTKYSGIGLTPRRTQMNTPATARRPMNSNRSPSPTPRGHKVSLDPFELLNVFQRFKILAPIGRFFDSQDACSVNEKSSSSIKSGLIAEIASWIATRSLEDGQLYTGRRAHCVSQLRQCCNYTIPPS